MIFPIIVFTKEDKKMWSMKNLMGDKRLLDKTDQWNSNIQVIDSQGKLFFIKKLEQDSSVLFLESIKSLGLMVKVKPILEKEPIGINLEELKERVKKQVQKNKQFWSAINDGRGLNKMIEECSSFEELIKMFI